MVITRKPHITRISSGLAGRSALPGCACQCAGGLVSSVGAEPLSQLLYGKSAALLTQEQKELVANLATLAGMGAGAAVGGSTGAGSGGVAAKVEVENNSLAGDKARESVKQSAEIWKDEVRDKLGNGTTSSIANGIINALVDTGDTAIGSADYVADAAMALASCATGDGYCDRALSDLAGKNQAVADGVKALMQSETWSAVADTLKQASEGNQLALEATGGMLAGLLSPGKKIPVLGTTLGKTEKLVRNTDGIYEVKVNVTPLEGHERLNTPDINGNGKYNPAEAAAAARMESALGPLERAPDTGGKTADFIISSGSNAGKTVDFMYTTKNLSQKEIDGMNKFFEKNMTVSRTVGEIPIGQKQILDHLGKADIVPVDFSVLTQSNQNVFMRFIKTLPKNQQEKIIIMR
ncbi:VENN motif pre-toxin domain-containing protein [Pseudomonas graminis]